MAQVDEVPRFAHHCPTCTFLGQHQEYDLYFCPQHGIPTVIARYGDKGPEYASGLTLAGQRGIPALAEAKQRAVARGLLPNP